MEESTMEHALREHFHRFLEAGAYCTPPGRAACALEHARTLVRFREMEEEGLVRLRQEEEQESYFDVYGTPDSKREEEGITSQIEREGCWIIISEYLDEATDTWQWADSIGMCIYPNPLDPFQNEYLPGLMRAACEQAARAQLTFITG